MESLNAARECAFDQILTIAGVVAPGHRMRGVVPSCRIVDVRKGEMCCGGKRQIDVNVEYWSKPE
jgi:hypothetical protein